MPRPVRVLLFATAREAAGRATIDLPVPPEGVPVDLLLSSLGHGHRALAAVLPDCRVARNGRYVARRGVRIRPGDEVAIHPPYTGG